MKSITNVAFEFNNISYQKVNNNPSSLCSIKTSFKSLGEKSRTSLMNVFEPLSVSDIKKGLMKASRTFCELDSMPACLVKECQAELIKVIRNSVNIPLKAGTDLPSVYESCSAKTFNNET